MTQTQATTPEPAGRAPEAARHILLYDGVCGFCNKLVQFVLRRDPAGEFGFAALQGGFANARLERYGRSAGDLDTFYAIVDVDTPAERILDRSSAALFVCGRLGWPWRALGVFWIVPKPLRDVGYRLVARVRYRLFGRHDACPIPSPDDRARFVLDDS